MQSIRFGLKLKLTGDVFTEVNLGKIIRGTKMCCLDWVAHKLDSCPTNSKYTKLGQEVRRSITVLSWPVGIQSNHTRNQACTAQIEGESGGDLPLCTGPYSSWSNKRPVMNTQ